MSLTQIVLPTNKSISVINDDTRTLNQDEKGLIQRFVILDANGQAYNLNDKKIQFNEQKSGGKVVIDDTNIAYIDRNAGTIDYKLHPQVYAASGDCWLAIINSDNSVVDTTKKFHYNVEKSATISIDNDNYVSSMEAQLANLKATVQRVDDTLNQKLTEYSDNANGKINDAVTKCQQALNNATNELNSYQSKYASLNSQWNQTFDKINSDAASQKNAIQARADQQAKDIQSRADNTNNSAIAELNKIKQDAASAIQSVNTQRDATIKTAQDQYRQELSNLQSDYNTWKANLNTDLTAQLKSITDQIASDKSATTQVHNEVTEILQQIEDAKKAWDSVDFTRYVTQEQFKTKASGLKVRGLRGDYVMAVNTSDSNIDATPGASQPGLVDMGVLAGAIQVMADAILDKNHYTKQEVDDMKQQVLDTVTGQINAVKDQLKNKADTQAVSANTQRITALENDGYVKVKFDGFSSADEAQKWAQDNHGIAIFDDGN